MKSNKTIGLKIYFWTNNLPKRVGDKDSVIPFWEGGQIALEANKEKGIKAQTLIFNSLEELPMKIKEILAKGNFAGVRHFGSELRAQKRNVRKNFK